MEKQPGATDFKRGLLLHLHPRTVPRAALNFAVTFGLGGICAWLIVLLLATGLLLMLVFEPTAAAAYGSIVSIRDNVLFGKLIRNMHHWSANLLVVVSVLHLVRIFLAGAFTGARAINWMIGLALLACVLAANFTGYLLPWDQLAYWAATICTGMLGYIPLVGEWLQTLFRGGEEVGGLTLMRFYALHTSLLPTAFALLMGFHFWKVRKAGGVLLPTGSDPLPRVASSPNLLVREGVAALVVTAALVCFSILVDAPLLAKANPGMSPNPAKAPWYFLGIQETLLHFHPVVAVVVVPLAMFAFLVALPWLSPDKNDSSWIISDGGQRARKTAAFIAVIITPLMVYADMLFSQRGNPVLVNAIWLRGYVLPALFLFIGPGGLCLFLQKRLSLTRMELIQSIGVLIFCSLTMLTLIGIWFRAEGMALTWTWN
jgi:quinol-cytochrome oxidoreductase complex cytochrome b subunit